MKADFIIDFLGFITVKAFSLVLWCVPLRPALWLGRRIGDITYHLNLKRRMIAYANLKAAFPEKTTKELRRINKRHFENLGMSIIELLKLPVMHKAYLDRHVKIENMDRIRQGLEKGKGVIILAAHFGNWEISSLAASLNGYKMSVFAREQKYERLNNLLNEFRQSTGCKVINKGFSVKDIIRTLHNNGIVAMLSDQDAGANGVFVRFFDRPASTAQGAVTFSVKTGATILPSFIWRVGTDKHVASAGDPLELVRTGDEKKDMKENLQRIADILESHIRKFPDQWLWAHKRWKSTTQRNVMVLTDGKAGHFNQGMAVAEMVEEALGSRLRARGIEERPVVKIHTVEIKFKNNFTRMLLNLTGIFASRRCQGCLRCLEFCLDKDSFKKAVNNYADIIISCGASTAAANIFLKYENNARGIAIMKPGPGLSKKTDLIILPRHDAKGRTRDNILITEGAPNRITDGTMEEAIVRLNAQGCRLERNGGIGLLAGGDAKGFKLEKGDMEKVISVIVKIAEEKDVNIYVSTSRRTSPVIDRLVKERLSGNRKCKLLVIANEKNIEGIVPAIFGLSDVIITSPESMSMISEAASSGKHVVVFSGRRQGTGDRGKKSKYSRVVLNLERQGYIQTAEPDKIYAKLKEILETMPEIRKLNDREKIIKRLQGLI